MRAARATSAVAGRRRRWLRAAPLSDKYLLVRPAGRRSSSADADPVAIVQCDDDALAAARRECVAPSDESASGGGGAAPCRCRTRRRWSSPFGVDCSRTTTAPNAREYTAPRISEKLEHLGRPHEIARAADAEALEAIARGRLLVHPKLVAHLFKLIQTPRLQPGREGVRKVTER